MSFVKSDPNLLNILNKPNLSYQGPFDAENRRHGNGIYHWNYNNIQQTYTGDLNKNNLHGKGFYEVERPLHGFFYDGPLFANKFEGYGCVFYENGCQFQGLFRQNSRYGPGIFTYEDGTQDVGLWIDTDLTRLNVLIEEENVPRLAVTYKGKMRLLKFKHLVPVCPKFEDVAKTVLKQMHSSEMLMKNTDRYYNFDVRHPDCIFFHQNYFNKTFYTEENCTIEIIQPEEANIMYEDEVHGISDRYKKICDYIQILDQKLNTLFMEKQEINQKIKFCISCCYPMADEAEDEASVNLDFDSTSTSSKTSNIKQISYDLTKARWSIFSEVPTHFGSRSDRTSTRSTNVTKSSIPSSTFTKKDERQEQEEEESENGLSIIMRDLCICDNKKSDLDIQMLIDTIHEINTKIRYLETIKHYLQNRLHLEFGSVPHEHYHTEKIVVTEILSCNNELTYMSILSHVFLNRKTESNVNFSVCEVMTGEYHNLKPGKLEKANTNFLTYCCFGSRSDLMEIYTKFEINPDVCDANGNNGVILAIAHGNYTVLKVLATFGANLDYFNDDGLNALNMSLLRFLACIHEVTNWEDAFLSPTEAKEDMDKKNKTWCNKTRTTQTKNEEDTVEQPYLFTIDLKPKLPAAIGEAPSNDSVNLTILEQKLKFIQKTIEKLLVLGANPNVCDVPVPSLFLAIFSEKSSLVTLLLDSGADPNVTITDDFLTCLHVAVTLKPIEENFLICSSLLEYADANRRTSNKLWPDITDFILGQEKTDAEDIGKTALHILAMRQDFLWDKCDYFKNMFMAFKTKCNIFSEYLGHNVLSLAVLFGNLPLIKIILESQSISPHEVLNYNMGNVMTLFILKRYKDIYPVSSCMEILNVIAENGGNPLFPIGMFENCVEFMEKEHEVVKQEKDKKKGKKDKNTKKDKKPKSITSKTSKKKQTAQEILQDYIRELCRRKIENQVQMKLTEAFYDLAEADELEHDEVKYVAQYLPPVKCLENLQYLFKYKHISKLRLNKELCVKVLEFLQLYQKKEKKKKGKKDKTKEKKKKGSAGKGKKKGSNKSTSTKTTEPELVIAEPTFSELVEQTDFSPTKFYKATNAVLEQPGLDNDDYYRICFNCLKGKSKTLLACPKCNRIFFCSEECNKRANKLDSFHTCKQVFYKKLKITLQSDNLETPPENELAKLIKQSKNFCHNRLLLAMQQRSLEKELRIQEALKMNPYHFYTNKKRSIHGRKVTVDTPRAFSSIDQERFLKKMAYLRAKQLDNVIKHTEQEPQFTNVVTKSICKIDLFDKQESENRKLEKLKESSLFAQDSSSSSDFEEMKKPKTGTKKCNRITCKKMPCIGTLAKKKGVTDLDKYFSNVSSKEKKKTNIRQYKEAQNFLKRLNKVPEKYQYFMEMLARFFPDVDLSFLFVPYTCYSSGQFYYKFLDGDVFAQTYSAM